MRILILVNPVSGTGKAQAAAKELAELLSGSGHEAQTVLSRPEPAERWLTGSVDWADLLVVAGGDGAIRLAAPVAAAAGVPIYQMPFGTENLFSRDWSMDRSRHTLNTAMARWDIRRVDLGRANGDPFVLMASIGFDAEVVHDLTEHRRGAIRHWSYALPIVRQLAKWKPPWVDIIVDGRKVVDRQPGFAVVANSPQYGLRLNPAQRADIQDGQLDVVFFPCRSRWGVLRWLPPTRMRRHIRSRSLVYEQGSKIEIRSLTDPIRFQIDGDCPADPAPVQELTLEVCPGALPVLVPVV